MRMHAVLEHLRDADVDVARAVADLRWGPLTAVMELLSSWWVKGPAFVLAALLVDLLRARAGTGGRIPVVALSVLVALLAAKLVGDELLKPLVDRPRPPLDGVGLRAIVALPASPSFPSGHATQAFAAATCLGVLVPLLRVPGLLIAALIALSRVYLGVHFPSDVVGGALLGALLGRLIARAALTLLRSSAAPAAPQPPGRTSAP